MLENAMSNLRINLPDQSIKPLQQIPIITSISSKKDEENVLYNNNIKIEVEVEEKDKKENEMDGKEEKNVMSSNEKKKKLENIDNILGFDAEQDKNDYFAGQLRGFTGNNNNSYNSDKNKNDNNNDNNSNNNSNNHENNKITSTKNISSDNFVSSNPPSFNPNYTKIVNIFQERTILQYTETEITEMENTKMVPKSYLQDRH